MHIKDKILTIRGEQVLLDKDLAELYGVETKHINRAVKRNKKRFPVDFCFQLTDDEFSSLRCQIGTANASWNKKRFNPHVFTEYGVANLSSVLNCDKAIKVNISIMRAFISMRRYLNKNALVYQRLDKIELKQTEYNRNFEIVFQAIEDKSIKPKQGIFYDGQIFDAYKFVSDLIRGAKEIILIDNYIDDTVLTLFSKSSANITIYTKTISKQLKLDLKKYNNQYKPITIKEFKKSHDRFLIIDNKIYHFGASLKDLGKRWFAFSILNKDSVKVLERLNTF